MPDFFTSPFFAPFMTKEARARWVKEILKSKNPFGLASKMDMVNSTYGSMPERVLSAVAGSAKPSQWSPELRSALHEHGAVRADLKSDDNLLKDYFASRLSDYRYGNRMGLVRRAGNKHRRLVNADGEDKYVAHSRHNGFYVPDDVPVPYLRDEKGVLIPRRRRNYSFYDMPGGKVFIRPWGRDVSLRRDLEASGHMGKLPRGLSGAEGNNRVIEFYKNKANTTKNISPIEEAEIFDMANRGVVDLQSEFGRKLLGNGHAYNPATNVIYNNRELDTFLDPSWDHVKWDRLPSGYTMGIPMSRDSIRRVLHGDLTGKEHYSGVMRHEAGHAMAIRNAVDPNKYKGVDLTNASPEVLQDAKAAEDTRKRYRKVALGMQKALHKLGLQTEPYNLLDRIFGSEAMANYYAGTARQGAKTNTMFAMPFLGPEKARQLGNSFDDAMLGAVGHAITHYGMKVTPRGISPLRNV